ncbi:MAG: thiol peroxidase [Bacteriovoracaceae bacterium]
MKKIMTLASLFLTLSCAHREHLPVDTETTKPGGTVSFKGRPVDLYRGGFKIGDDFTKLIKDTDLEFKFNQKVTIVSIVPSIDTPVCEAQTHDLGENYNLSKDIELVTISRDLPMAQQRFAREAKLSNISYYSDYKTGSFGKKTGLLMKGKELLARSIIVLDQKGIIRYYQVNKEQTKVPDMNRAFMEAEALLGK